MIAKKTWVQIEQTILETSQRAQNLPQDTKLTPLKAWIKGFLLEDAKLGDIVRIETVTGRIETGILVQERPYYTHSFGKVVDELFEIDHQIKSFMKAGDSNE